MCGKSQLILELLRNRDLVYTSKFTRIVYSLPEDSAHLHQDYLADLRQACPELEVVEGLPDLSALELRVDKRPKLLILDDLIQRAFNSQTYLTLATQDSHHCNISLIISTQNIFLPTRSNFIKLCPFLLFAPAL